MSDEALNPVEIERKVTQAVNALFYGQKEFATRRDAMTQAEIKLLRARRIAAAREDCPRPARGGVTVAERESWIQAAVGPELEDQLLAESALDIAQSSLRVNRDILSGLQTLARSVDSAYRSGVS